eukprot:10621549-Alexandrium_andersonii.AAC.1
MQHYGSLPLTTLSLFMAISGGASWGDLVGPLVHISPVYTVVYSFGMILVMFGLLNILSLKGTHFH